MSIEEEAQIVEKGLEAFLESSGVLKNDIPEEIQNKKLEYRKIYKRVHRRKQRVLRPNLSVVFKDKKTYEIIKKKAKAINRDVSSFLQESALAYTNQKFVNPEKVIYQEIVQLFTIIELHIYNILESAEDDGGSAMHYYNLLVNEVTELKQETESILDEPKLLKSAIHSYIKDQTWLKQELLDYIEAM